MTTNKCFGCKGIYSTSNNKNKLILTPQEENEDIRIRYEYKPKRSKYIEIKYITVWTNTSYIPVPVFIYDKSLACSFETYKENNEERYPFDLITSTCHTLPAYNELDFGPVAQRYDHTRKLTLVNLNPLPLFIQKIRATQVSCENEVVSFKDAQSNKHNFIELIPKTTIDIFSGKRKRDYKDEDKLFDQIYDPKQDKDIKVMISESSDFIIPANSIVNFEVKLRSPKIRPGNK